jgi:hypothetical protein
VNALYDEEPIATRPGDCLGCLIVVLFCLSCWAGVFLLLRWLL